MRRALLIVLVLCSIPALARVRAVRPGWSDSPAAWLRARAVDDAGLIALAASARVVALGDATHGSHESYAAKQRLVPLLAANGFRTIAFEAPYAEWKALDDYVTHGTGNPAAALRFRMYWFWDSEEILDVIRWARAQNEAGLTPPIRIEGVDATEPVSASRLVLDFLRDADPAAAALAEESYSCLDALRFGFNPCEIGHIRASLERDHASASEIIHAARVVEQGIENFVTSHDARDTLMAENVQRLVDRGEKVIVFGHNEHWGRTPYRMRDPEPIKSAGTHLSESLGDAYFAAGSLFLDGTFLAIDYEQEPAQIRTQIMTAPSIDDFALLFDQAGLESMIVPMRGPLPSWLAGTHRMRFAGSSVKSRTKTTIDVHADLGEKFDAVLYFRRSTPAQLRHWPLF